MTAGVLSWMNPTEPVVRSSSRSVRTGLGDTADPITTEIIRQGLNAAAEHMKRTVIRTAFSPIIYEALDFAVALYDADLSMLAQAPTLPSFMGTLGFCVEAAVTAVGGADKLGPGDVVLYNDPFGTGTHPQDAALIVPIYALDTLVGYAAIKAHWLDIGGKDPYCTDTVDVFQEGTIFPGVKLYEGDELVDPIYRMVLANSRIPDAVIGDINAMVAGARSGGAALTRIVERYGLDEFRRSVSRIFDHGEAMVRHWFEQLPDGVYSASSVMDGDGVIGTPIPFEVTVRVHGSSVTVDYTNAPDQTVGPINSPLPSTVAVSRLAIAYLVGNEAPNEGHFRPLEVLTRPASIFHPVRPAPSFMYGVPSDHAIEMIITALAPALPDLVPASSGGDICSLVWWGTREETGEPWADGAPHPVGLGASRHGDGASTMIFHSESATRFTPAEIWEARNPWLIEQCALAEDSGGAGKYRGGLGLNLSFRVLEDCFITVAIARTKLNPWGLEGGGEGRPNDLVIEYPDGRTESHSLSTRVTLPKGTIVHLRSGSGGGHGDPSQRDIALVQRDLAEGYISGDYALTFHPHAL